MSEERPETQHIYNFGDTVRLINLEATKFADMNHKTGTLWRDKAEVREATTEKRKMWALTKDGRHTVQIMIKEGGVFNPATSTYTSPKWKRIKVLPKCMELVKGCAMTNALRSSSTEFPDGQKLRTCKSEMFAGGPTGLVFFDAMKAMDVEGARNWLHQMTTYCAKINETFVLQRGKFGDGPLQGCLDHCTKRSGEMVRLLVQHGDDPNQILNPKTPMGQAMQVPIFIMACIQCNGECFDVIDALVEGGADVNKSSKKFGNALIAIVQNNMPSKWHGHSKKNNSKTSLSILRYLLQESSYRNQFDVNRIESISNHPSVPPVEQHMLQIIFSSCIAGTKEKHQKRFREMLCIAMKAGARPGLLYQQYDDWTKKLEPVCAFCMPLSHIADGDETKRKSFISFFLTMMQHAPPAVRLENMDTRFEPLAMEMHHPLCPVEYALYKTMQGAGGAREALEILLCAGVTMSKKLKKVFERNQKSMAKKYNAAVKAGTKCDMCDMYVIGKGQRLLSCSGCATHKKKYCCKECQVRHWKEGGHKQECSSTIKKRKAQKKAAAQEQQDV